MKKLLIAMFMGAAVAYFFDPVNGSDRRASMSRMAGSSGPARPVTVLNTDDSSAPLAAAQ